MSDLTTIDRALSLLCVFRGLWQGCPRRSLGSLGTTSKGEPVKTRSRLTCLEHAPRDRRVGWRSRLVLTGLVAGFTLSGCKSPTPVDDDPLAERIVEEVVVTPNGETLSSVGATVQLSATAQDASGPISGKTFTWESSDEAVATVDGSGLVTAAGNGSATITATTGGTDGAADVVVSQVATALRFEAAPSLPEANSVIQPAVVVHVLDELGSLVTNWTDPVSLQLTVNPCSATLGGTLTVATQDGVAAFSDILIDEAGVGYALTASSGALSETTEPFDVFGRGQWTTTGSMAGPRRDHTATLLDDGTVLVVGGTASGAEIYDPATGSFAPTTSAPVFSHGQRMTATKLDDGTVLLVGGTLQPRAGEIYDPVAGTFDSTATRTNAPRVVHTATKLPDGRVLLAAGKDPSGPSHALAEIFDPASGSYTAIGDLNEDRSSHAAVLLSDGRVLVVGGQQTTSPGFAISLATAELHQGTTFSLAGDALARARTSPLVALLNDGRVLVGGGLSTEAPELFDPVTDTFEDTGDLAVPHSRGTATRLENGVVLVAGGFTDVGPVVTDQAELYYTRTAEFVPGASMTVTRQQHTATRLTDGRVLVVGGFDGSSGVSSAEIYTPPACTP